ncbi:OmpA family protein [Xanthomonas sacchari]|uniref:OmpA family protein n=1 Tax=Xanthomonas sacchari TaxID=56458 RepID=UPI002257B084|nr:OmpA family protein [Xanthomonas sacchari]MCW0452302.1 Peptidoglycan-associated lipoprotein [Xanthomonas sacchari]
MTAMTLTARRAALSACLLLIAATAGCKRSDPQQATDAPAPAASATTPAASASAAAPATETAHRFDAARMPVSDTPLGSFPYLGLPEGYVTKNAPVRNDFDRVPFWTGDRIEWVEGKVYAATLGTAEGKPFSGVELSRNIQTLVESLGGQRIASGPIPADAAKAIGDSKAAVTYVDGIGDIYNEPADTFVIHRADRDIWIHVCSGPSSGGLLIAETKPFQATAKALPADALQQQLASAGKVAIQVNFASDAAQILPDSRPQLEQVLQLLKADSALRLAVNGHTDNSGDAAHNKSLSEARASSVVSYLTGAGIAADRLRAAGFGQEQPIAPNTTEEGKARNRRVELVKL